jgi:Ca2+-binding EF-hand superfamily protein
MMQSKPRVANVLRYDCQHRAGGIVTHKYGDFPPTSNFLDTTGGEDNSVKHLRNRVHVLQIAHLKSMQELERCEKMLQAQTNINRELALEIEELTTSKISSSNQLQRRMKELELLCEERHQRIITRQAEIKQLKYAREKLLLKARDAGDACSEDSRSDDEMSEAASLSESLILAARGLAPGEQLLELGIVGGNFDSNVVGINSSTFVLCDFFDFESQSTPLLMGSRPEYNLSATFKVTVDGFFLRYLATEAIVLEVHQAVRGDFKLIGKSSIRLAKLLQSKGVVKEPLLTINSTSCINESGATVIGTLNVVLRLSTPISEVWQVHLRSYPQDLKLLSATSKRADPAISRDVLCDDDITAAGRLTNELQITVFGCRNLRSYGKRTDSAITRLPSSYVHYQLLGFPDVFTNIVPESASPGYDLSCSQQAFVLAVDACLLRFLSKFRFWITVFDDQAELDEGAHEDGMVGRCGLTLSDLVNGENIRGWFPLKDQNDKHAGDISVLIQWKDPFQVLQMTSSQRTRGVNGRPIDVYSLDFDQQHALLAMFSADMDGRVNYRQFLHYAVPSEELELLVAKLKERFEHAIDSELVTSVQDALTSGADVKQRKRMHLPMRLFVRAGEKYGVFLSDAEQQILQVTFGVTSPATETIPKNKTVSGMENEPETLIELNYLLLHINPRLSCAERLLGHKIRQTMRVYAQEQRRRKPALVVPANKPFEKFDDAKCGKITRSAFRKCLSALGFDLMNVESEYRELVRSHINQPISDDPHIDLVPIDASLSSQAGIDLDEDVLENATQVSHQPKRLSCGSDKTTTSTVNQRDQPTRDPPERFVTPLPASSEFQRRKQAFMDRMKAIVSASSKNLVYEQVEKKLHEQRAQEKKQQTTLLPRQELLQEHLKRLHVPQNIHHEAARTLQRQYRQYKEQQQEQVYRHSCSSIVAADLELQRILRKWTIADLCNLEDIIVNEIERDAPEAKRTRLLSKKQLSYFLSKVSRIALPPALLWQLMDYFAVKESGMVVYRRLLNFIFSTCTAADEKDHDKKMRLSVMDRLLLDVGLAHHMFASAGDMTHMGVISIGKFRECLTRLGVRLSPKDFHLITVLFDVNGFEILYHALVHSLAQLPNCQQLAKAIERCRAFGIPSLREKLLTCTSSDDGRMPREEFLRVLMQQNTEVEQFRPEDAGMLFQMIVGVDDCTMGMPIEELCIRLEAAARYRRKSVYDEWDKYDIHQLQRLAWNCRNLLCGSYIDLKSAFERFDWQETGSVSLIEFVSIARRNGFTMFTENQLRGVAKQFGAKTNGSFGIKYKEFLDWTTPPPPVDMDTVEAKLRKFAQTKAETLPTRQLSDILASWNMIFVAKAESRPGGINRSQFVTICKTQLGLPLDENEMRALLYTYDPQLEDRIDYSAFLWLNWREAAISRTEKRKVANATAQAKGSTKNTRKEDIATVAAVPGTQALAPKASISHLSDFLDWCEDRGVDLRGELEAYDSAYTGFVTATELKQTLFRLGISKMDSSSFAEAAIGQLLRQFRHPERTDAVNYTKMISQAAKLDWFGADSQWHDQISELLRSRIRSKANLTGKIDHSDKANYVRFDAAFSHFDRERKGFLTAENIRNGLLALNYQPTPAQLGLLMAQMRIFRHDGGGLSRTEFDSFVLDPYGFRLMNKLSKQLYSVVEPRSHDTMPRVAYLSRLLMEYGGSNDASSLPANTFWTQLERALERQVTDVEKLRLQHLFDVNRDSQIAYKLFLKVMSQWRTPVSGPVLLAESKSTEERPPVPLEKQPIAQVQHKTEQPSCSRDAVLHSLYNQMSSIDFNSQLDIVEEYLRENDRKHTGSIKTKQLKRVFEQIGLSLSVDAFTSLQMFYPGIDSPNKTQEQGELVAYEKLLLALVALHERSHDHESK